MPTDENLHRGPKSGRTDHILRGLSLFPDRRCRAIEGKLSFPRRNFFHRLHHRRHSGGDRHNFVFGFAEKEKRLSRSRELYGNLKHDGSDHFRSRRFSRCLNQRKISLRLCREVPCVPALSFDLDERFRRVSSAVQV